MVGLRVSVIRTHLSPINASVGIGAYFCIQVLHQVGCILRIAAAQAVHIDNLRVHLVGKVCNFCNAEVGLNTSLPRIIIEAVDLVLAVFFRSQGGFPVEQIGNGSTGITDGAKTRIHVQLGKLLFHLHRLRIKGTITVKRIAVINTKNGICINDPVHLVQVDRQVQRDSRLVCGYGIL